MQKSKLIKLLMILNPEEFKEFPKFISSPFFNTNRNFLPLYNFFKKHYPEFNTPALSPQQVFGKVFPGKKFHYNNYHNLISGFTRLTKDYLTNLQFQKDHLQQEKTLLNVFEQRNAYDFFKKQVTLLNEKLETLPFRSTQYFYEKFKLNQVWLNHPGLDKFQLSSKEHQVLLDSFDTYFSLEKLLLSIQLKSRTKLLAEKYEIWLLEEIKNKRVENPLFNTYLAILELLEVGEEAAYYKLKQSFEQYLKQFSEREQKSILQILINYSIGKGNAGDFCFIKENFELYTIGLNHNLFLENGLMDDDIYSNIVGIAVKAKQFSWCYQFINEYEALLDAKIGKDAKALSLGIWYYYQEQYEAASDYLNSVIFANDFYQLRGRSLLIKIYFEQFLKDIAYFDLLIMQCNAFEKYIRRNTLIASNKGKAYLDFVLLLKKLAKNKMNYKIDASLKSKWLDQINAKAYVYGKDWLKKKIELL